MKEHMTKKYSISLDNAIAEELERTAASVGFSSVEDLYMNYTREIILASRADRAAQAARSQIVAQASDLNDLIPKRQDSSSKS